MTFKRYKTTTDEGVPVEYNIYPWPAGHGLEMGALLISPIEEALGHIGELRTASTALGDELKELKSASMFDLFATFGDKAGPALQGVLARVLKILNEEGSDLFLDLLLGSQRVPSKPEGAPVENFKGDGQATRTTFDRVYGRNYGELFRVSLAIIMYNFGPLWTDTGNANGEAPPEASPRKQRRERRALKQ